MSIFRLAIATLLLTLVNFSCVAQDCNCEPSGGRGIPMFQLPFGGCGQGCSNNRDRECLTSDQLWAGWEQNTNCKGCQQRNVFRPHLPNLPTIGIPHCGMPAMNGCGMPRFRMPNMGLNRCRSNGCSTNECQATPVAPEVIKPSPSEDCGAEPRNSGLNLKGLGLSGCGLNRLNLNGSGLKCRTSTQTINIPVPHVSINWPNPIQVCSTACDSLKPRLTDGFNLFGKGRAKQVRNDIPNDPYGRLGESRRAFEPLPTAAHGVGMQDRALSQPNYQDANDSQIPPAPIVEPISEPNELPAIDNAKKLNYGNANWSR